MGRYGIRIVQQGFDVEKAADYQTVLNSDWKFLDILEEIGVDVTVPWTLGTNSRVPIFAHGLDYAPAFEFFPHSDSGELFNGYRRALSLIRSDRQYIYAYSNPGVTISGSSGTYRIKGKLRVFRLDINEEYQAPTIPALTAEVQPPSRYGAKFLDRNAGASNINSENIGDFTLNTRGKQLSIHKHGTSVASADTSFLLDIVHNIGYPPSYYLCKIEDYIGLGEVVGAMVNSYNTATVTTTNITFKGIQSVLLGKFGYVILKDPAEIAG